MKTANIFIMAAVSAEMQSGSVNNIATKRYTCLSEHQ